MDLIEKLWGISKKTAKKLYDVGIETIESVVSIDVSEVSKAIGVRETYLKVASSIAKEVSSDYVETIGPKTLTISRKIYGVGTDTGLLLYSLGIKDITDVTEDLQLTFPAMQEYFEEKFEKIKSQVQLSLIPGLTSRNGYELVKGEFTSLDDLAGSTATKIVSVCKDVSKEQADLWISMASKIVSAGILNYKKAGELLLAQKIKGIGPEFAAILYCLNIKSLENLICRLSFDTRNTYFPWVKDWQIENWIKQALDLHANMIGVAGSESEGYYPYGMNEAEFWESVRNPGGGITAKVCGDIAEQRQKDNYGSEGGVDDEADAFRHALWNCCMTMGIGEVEAEAFANAHEKFESPDSKSSEMDKYNNRVGRKLHSDPENVLGPGDWSGMDCEDRVKEAISRGNLVKLDSQGNLIKC